MRLATYLRDAAVFAPCYVALDWASYIDPVGPFNITPWNPQAALAIVWMLFAGLAQAPTVVLTIALADVAVRHAPGGYVITAATALILGTGYALIALALRRVLKDAALRTARDLTLFSGVALAGTALTGAAFTGFLRATGHLQQMPFPGALLRFWIGDAVGVLITAPLLLAAVSASRRAALARLARQPEPLLQAAVLAGLVWLIFTGLSGDPARHFYVLFLPLIWIAARHGMNGAIVAMAIVQIGVVLGIHRTPTSLSVVELQALVAALTLTALFLGVMVDERQRAEEDLRQTLRLAAAGEMAGAIAHEVNQPLTALANNGRAAQMLLEGRPDSMQLQQIIAKVLAEADRASDVVRRLRDFFRAGTTRLQAVEVESLLGAARKMALAAVGDAPIDVAVESESPLPSLFVDRLQVELVLRNLIANAAESLQASPRKDARIAIRAARLGDRVRITVTDNGPGMTAAMRVRLFEPFASDKPAGMGLGLAVSRAIAEAHGGSLEVTGAGHGEFHLVLPCQQNA
jgi:two-component system sensor kinase FixL